jgi:hypothetical protein
MINWYVQAQTSLTQYMGTLAESIYIQGCNLIFHTPHIIRHMIHQELFWNIWKATLVMTVNNTTIQGFRNVLTTGSQWRLWQLYFQSWYKSIELNSVAWVRERTILTEGPPPHGQRDGSLRPYSRASRPEPLLLLSSSSHCNHEAEWTPFKTHNFSENMVASGIEPRPQVL